MFILHQNRNSLWNNSWAIKNVSPYVVHNIAKLEEQLSLLILVLHLKNKQTYMFYTLILVYGTNQYKPDFIEKEEYLESERIIQCKDWKAQHVVLNILLILNDVRDTWGEWGIQ